jgi:hypothetical protein
MTPGMKERGKRATGSGDDGYIRRIWQEEKDLCMDMFGCDCLNLFRVPPNSTFFSKNKNKKWRGLPFSL